jgi:hypothetical protein
MTLTPDWQNRIVDSSSSIDDIVAFHAALRELEASPEGILFPAIHSFRAISIGGGGFFHAVDFINGWRLRFPAAGNYTVTGNIGADVVPVAGVFVMQTKALAFATTSGAGGGGASSPSADAVANAVWSHPFANTLLTVKKFLGFS